MVATMLAQTSSFLGTKTIVPQKQARAANRSAVAVRAGAYDEELIQTAVRSLVSLLVAERAPACPGSDKVRVAGVGILSRRDLYCH